jgi:hypothetical protein
MASLRIANRELTIAIIHPPSAIHEFSSSELPYQQSLVHSTAGEATQNLKSKIALPVILVDTLAFPNRFN